MWKKPEERMSEMSDIVAAPQKALPHHRTVVGNATTIVGDICGEEDLLVDGIVRGSVKLPNHMVTIGKSGKVKAMVVGRVVHVDGEVEGDISATEQVVVHRSGHVKGNIAAPRVVLEDGSRLKGSINTDTEAVESVSLGSSKMEVVHNDTETLDSIGLN